MGKLAIEGGRAIRSELFSSRVPFGEEEKEVPAELLERERNSV